MRLAMMATILALSVCTMAQSNPSKVFKTSGAAASLYGSAVDGAQLWLYASHTHTQGTPSTFLEFDIFTRNPDGSFTDTFGFGDVPDGSLSGNSTTSLSLSVDTSQVSGFQTTTCKSDGVCTPGPFGLVHIDFNSNGDYSSQSVSENHYDFFQMAQRSHYDYNSSSADANGTILGNILNDVASDIGTNRGTTITLTKKH